MPVRQRDGGEETSGKTPKIHVRCADCGARRVHLRVGAKTLECMACGTRTRTDG